MSIFKIKQCWSNEKSQSEDYDDGIQNGNCIIVDKFNSHSDSDLIILAQNSVMKIYKPRLEHNESENLILESQLNDIALQIDTGKFLADCADRQILILHRNSYAIYLLDKHGGQTDIANILHCWTRPPPLKRGPYSPRWACSAQERILVSDFLLPYLSGLTASCRWTNCSDGVIYTYDSLDYTIRGRWIVTSQRLSNTYVLGDQNYIAPVIKHLFTRRAYSATCGPFGNSRSRDLICIQALDGTLSFFDQDTFLFMCIFNDIIIPGLINYVPNSDLFVIWKSTWILEIYSYQQLREFSELSTIRPNKNNIPQWTYNAGEEITSIQVIRTSTNFSSIVAVGERHLYCFQDNGLMKYMIRFDYEPICFHAYLIGWYYEPNSRLLVMVASEDAKLFIYEGTTLLWSCDLTHKAISISRCFLSSLSGGLVTLSTNGVVSVSYLGTEPDLNATSSTNPMNETFDPSEVQLEIETVEETLQKIMNATDLDEDQAKNEPIIKIKVDLGKPVNNLASQFAVDNNAEPLQTCTMIVMITCEDPKLIQSLQITYDCTPPITSSETTICLDTINGTEIIETYIFLSGDTDISDSGISVKFTVIDNMEKVRVISERALLPLNLYCLPVEADVENNFQITIETNQSKLNLVEIFTDFNKEELAGYITPPETLTYAYRTSYKTVTFKAHENNTYTIEANEVSEISPMLDHFLHKLEDCYNRMGILDYEIHIAINGELIRQVLHKLLKSIETHAKERIVLKDLEDELNVLQRQFTVIQKKLLVQYGSLPPGDCDPLEFLMKDTHERIKTVAYEIIQSKNSVLKSGNTLRATGSLMVYILKETVTDNLKVKLIEEMLSLETLNGQFQEWEEAVAQVSSYILNKILKKTEKDKEKLAPVTDQDILSQTNLKKLLKQVRIILEKIFFNIQDTDAGDGNITRIEEFVEVI